MSVAKNRFMQRCVASRSGRSTPAVRPAFIEPLEGRVLLSTTIVVNTTTDAPHAASLISLRDAVTKANASATPVTITFSPTVFKTSKTILLTGNQLAINPVSKSMTIKGPAARLTIDAQTKSRVFSISMAKTLTLSGLTMIHGGSGAINNVGTLKMSASLLSQNGGAVGAGLYNSGIATLTNVTISGNNAPGYDGAGIYNYHTGNLTLINDTISGNTGLDGGGIFNYGVAALTNVTVAGNTGIQRAGGIYNYGTGSMTLKNVTIAGNVSKSDYGGGLYISSATAVVSIANTIIAGNTTRLPKYGPDVSGVVHSLGFNLIGATDDSSGWKTADRTGSALHPLNASLTALANHGGSTLTMMLLSSSPAINHGSNSLITSGISTDQRGRARISKTVVDIGACEYQFAATVP